MDEQKDYAEDKVYRAWGILSGARIMTLKEFYPLWSTLRTGMLLGMIRPDLGMINHLLEEVQDEHVAAYMEHKAEKDAINTMRATRIREALREAGTTAL